MKLSEQDSYTTEDLDEAMEVLIEANMIRKNPELLKLIQQHGKKMKAGITSVEQMRAIANDMMMQDSEQDAPEEKKSEKKQKKPQIKNVADLRAAAKASKESDQE